MHRSGTSLVAEMLHRWGAFGRVAECLPANQWNAHGYWELAPLVDFNNRLLAAVGATWTCPPDASEDAKLTALARQPAYRAEALQLLASMKGSQNGNWFWKDPRLSLLLPFWQQLWGDVRYVICVRDPLEICRSLRERDDLNFGISIVLWQRYMLAILERTSNARAIFLSYSALLQNSAHECLRLSRFLSRSTKTDSANVSLKAMRAAVDSELRHFSAKARHERLLLDKSQTALQTLLECLAQSRVTGEKLHLRPYALPAFWRSGLQANLLLRRCWLRWNRLFQTLPTNTSDVNELSQALALGTLEVSTSLTDSGYASSAFCQLAALSILTEPRP